MNSRAIIIGSLLVLAVGCSSSSEAPLESAALTGADETVEAPEYAPTGCVRALEVLATAAPLNLREGASTDSGVLLVIPAGSELPIAGDSSCAENGFYKVRFGGFEGWVYGAWLRATRIESALSYANSRDAAMERAKSGMGFSYWWGHGRWLETGATSTNKGSCTGGCPSCTHSGTYGADCSGFAAKVWVVPSTNNNVAVDSHPYSTYHFENEYHGWHNVSRDNIQRADALVYNDGGGHILIYERGDPWGSLYAYECKGCADGCVYNIRAVGSAYKAISRDNIASAAPVDDDLYGVVRTTTGSGMTEVHALERTTNYQSYSVHAALPLGYTGTDGSWNFQVADYNNDGKKDVWAIRKDSAKTQVHILNGADNFQTFLYRVDTYLGTTGTDYTWVFLVGDYNKDGKQDLWAIKKVSTTTEVHILNGADGFQTMLLQSASALEPAGSDNRYMFTLSDYNNDGRLDLLAVKKASTGSGKTELHVVNGADGFKTFLAHIATYLGVTGTDSSWAFAAGDYNRDGKKDLYAIKKNTTSQTEIHVLNGADGYQSMLTQVATVLQYTGSDSRWVFDL